ncbi:MAG TPA: hypothetical protein VHV75_02690 [Solirubrobacteraceae bacterium]|nr:hypothetical protein [Solirubrobacteraceae bacterium]
MLVVDFFCAAIATSFLPFEVSVTVAVIVVFEQARAPLAQDSLRLSFPSVLEIFPAVGRRVAVLVASVASVTVVGACCTV